jgi:hypothetical protein
MYAACSLVMLFAQGDDGVTGEAVPDGLDMVDIRRGAAQAKV